VTPLVWRSENLVRGTTAWAAFPWVSYRDPRRRNRVLFPLFWQFGDRTTGATTTAIVPARRRTRRPGRGFTLGLAPLLTFARHDPKGRSFQVVTPLFWRFRDRTAYGGQGSQQIVLAAAVRLQPEGPAPRRRRAPGCSASSAATRPAATR
jgi:hypothetical protein